MLFNKFCKITERNLIPEISKDDFIMLTCARLFEFTDLAQNVLPKYIDDDYDTNFFLPYPTTAIEDNASLVILMDTKLKQLGAMSPRFFVEVVTSHAPDSSFDRLLSSKAERDYMLAQPELISVVRGYLAGLEINGDHVRIHANVSHAHHFMGTKLLDIRTTDQMKQACMSNTATALQQIAYLNASNNFILESTPVKAPKKRKGRILRSTERPLFTLLKPNEIRTKLGLPASDPGTGSKKRPHDRRAHLRTIHRGTPNERRVHVSSCWIGHSTAQIQGRHYRVVLDEKLTRE